MKYAYQASEGGKHFILLHGTGGDESSLAPIARFLDDACGVLAFRGNIQEDGMNRFFKRNGLNQFDYESLESESDHLLAEIETISQAEGIPLEDWILVGYSNGANIAAHILLERETPLQRGIFFHPMSLEKHTQTFSLSDKQVWVSYGEGDPIVSPENFNELVTQFENRGGDVTVFETKDSHQITMDEVKDARRWLASLRH